MLISVLSIIGTVLKWILFVILGIIALVLLLVILICSSLLRYRIEGTKKGKKFEFRAKAGYLLSLIRVSAVFKDKKLTWKVMAAWKQVAGSDMPKSEKEEKKLRSHGGLTVETIKEGSHIEEPEVKSGSVRSDAIKSDSVESDSVKSGAVKSDSVKSDAKQAETEKTDAGKGNVEQTEKDPGGFLTRLENKGKDVVRNWRDRARVKKAQREEAARVKAEEKAKREAEKAEKERQKAESREAGRAARAQRWEELPDKVLDALGNILDAILDGPDKIEDLLEEKIVPKYEKFEKYYRLFDKYPRKPETIRALLGVILHILRPLMPRRYEAEVEFGTGDPYQSALWMGRIYALEAYLMPRQTRRRHLDVFPDMENKRLDISGKLRGRFSVNLVLVFPLIRALFNKDIQRLIRFVLKLRKKKKQKDK